MTKLLNIKGSKVSLRTQLLEARTSLSEDDFNNKNQLLTSNLTTWLDASGWKKIFSFKAFRGEPDLDLLLKKIGKIPFFFPVMTRNLRAIDFYRWELGQPLQPNKYGINEPEPLQSNLSTPDQQTLIIVPCLACSTNGTRLGYGGGYYDRYLERYPDAVTIGVVFSDFLIEGLPRQAHDKKLRFIATEHKIISCS